MAAATMKVLLVLLASLLASVLSLEECVIPNKVPTKWEDIVMKCQPFWDKNKYNYCYAKCVMKEGQTIGPDEKLNPNFDLKKTMEGLEHGRFYDEFYNSAEACLKQHGAAMDPGPADCMGYKPIVDCFLLRMCKECDFHGHCGAWAEIV